MSYQMKSVQPRVSMYSFIHSHSKSPNFMGVVFASDIYNDDDGDDGYLVDNRLIGWPKIFLAAMSSLYAVIMLLDFEAFMFQALRFLSCSFRFAQW